MEIVRKDQQGVTVLELHGRFDELAAPEVERQFLAVLQDHPRRLVLDLSAVEYISSSGLRVLLMLLRVLKKTGGELKLCGLTPFVAEVFDVSNFTAMFDIHPRRNEAVQAFA